MSRIHTILCICTFFLLFSCRGHETNSDAVYTVSYSDFLDIILVDGVVEPVHSTTVTCPREADAIIVYLVEDGVFVEEGDLLCVLEDQSLQNRYDEVSVNLENAKADLNKTRADLAMQYALLEAQVKSNEAETLIANLDSLQLLYATPTQRRIKELELEKTAIEKAKYDKKLTALDIIQQSEIRKRELQIQRMQNQVKSAEESLEKLEVRASKKGLATRPTSWVTGKKLQVGDNVWNNMPLVVIPEMEEMKVKIMAPERDFKLINQGDSVVYTFDAMPGNTAYGKILRKTPVGQQVNNSKVKFFEIEASIDSFDVKPELGFTANCHVILKEVKDTIIVPQIAVFDIDSMKVVYVKQRKGYEMREVETGLSSQKETVISQGLKAGELIALIKPNASLIVKNQERKIKNQEPGEKSQDAYLEDEKDDESY